MSKFDVILIAIGVLVALACAADLWLIVHGFPEFGHDFWTLVIGLSGGEIATYSLYRMVKRVGQSKVDRVLAENNRMVQADMEDEGGTEDEQQTSE